MKEVILLIKGDKCKIMAEGALGRGTEKFTEDLAKYFGEIIERHKCGTHTHDEVHSHDGITFHQH